MENLQALQGRIQQDMQAIEDAGGDVDEDRAIAWAGEFRHALEQLLGALRSTPIAEVRRHLDVEEHVGLLVEHAQVCLNDLGGQQAVDQAQAAYLAVWEDPACSGPQREAEFQRCVALHLRRAHDMAQAAQDLLAARALMPANEPGVDPLAELLEEDVPPTSQPLLCGMTLAATAVGYAEYELGQLGASAPGQGADVDPALLGRVSEVYDHFWLTNILEFADAFSPAAFQRLLSPALQDLREGTLDVMALAIECPLGTASGSDDPAGAYGGRLVQTLIQGSSQFLALVDLAGQAAPTWASAEAGTRDAVSAVTDRGLHLPVRTDPADQAQASTEAGVRFSRQADGQWREADTALEEALRDLRDPAEPLSRPAARIRAATSARRLLDLDVEADWQACLRDAQTVFPETLATRYQLMSQRWAGRATAMEVLGRRLASTDEAPTPAATAPSSGPGPDAGLAKSLSERAQAVRDRLAAMPPDAMRLEFIKCHARPQAALWAELLEAGQARVGEMRALSSALQNTLYECALFPTDGALSDRHQPAAWVHLHLHQPRPRQDLASLTLDDLAAAHLKSDAERRHGANWQAQMRAWTHQPVQVHRSPLDDRLLRLVLAAMP